jgi:hypothetical protein
MKRKMIKFINVIFLFLIFPEDGKPSFLNEKKNECSIVVVVIKRK